MKKIISIILTFILLFVGTTSVAAADSLPANSNFAYHYMLSDPVPIQATQIAQDSVANYVSIAMDLQAEFGVSFTKSTITLGTGF